MKIGVSLNLDVTKIDKARLVAGNKGKYLDATVFIEIDIKDQYGNSGMITQNVSKDEKNNGVKGNILGNCKVFWSDTQRNEAHVQGHAQVTQAVAPQASPPAMDDFDDDLGF